MKTTLAPGFHVAPGRAVDGAAYDRFVGRWSRLFVPAVLAAAEVQPGCPRTRRVDRHGRSCAGDHADYRLIWLADRR